jgi:hypothetical protein
MRTSARRIIPAGLLVVSLAACGGGGGDGDSVASLDGTGSDDTASADDGGGGGGQGGRSDISPEFQDAMVEFAECMRDHGLDFPDPGTSGDGLVVIGPGGDGEPPSQTEVDEFEAADEACRHILEAVADEMPRPDPEQEAEMRDQALAFAECMRDHGVDFPDPQFDEGGRTAIGVGEIDPSEPEFQDAQEACAKDGGGIFSVGGGPGGGPVTGNSSASESEDG